VRVEGSTDVFLQPRDAPQLAGVDMTGVLAITPQTRKWKFLPSNMSQSIEVARTQLPLLPQKQCTLHGVQGKTAEPGFIVHWTFPPRLSKESIWLAYYVSLSRPRSFKQLLSHGMPLRKVIGDGPPEEIAKALHDLFADKIAATKIACAKARADMHWPARNTS